MINHLPIGLAQSILGDLRVLDLSEGLTGPLCARILGDFGADVIKIELPEGDRSRRWAPFEGDVPDPEKSLIFRLANLNKRGIELDYRTPAGAAALRHLAQTADIVIESGKPGALDSLGLGYAGLSAENDKLIMVSITPFGQTGPYCHFESEEIITYALSGIMSFSGEAGREPLKHGGMQSQYEGALSSALAALIGVTTRDIFGEGQHIDVSLQDVVTSTLVIHQPFYSWAGAVQGRRQPGAVPYGQIQKCKDGYFVWQTGGGAEWEDIANFFGTEELKDERFATFEGRQIHAVEIDRLVLDAVKDRTKMEMFREASDKYRMLFGVAQEPSDLTTCSHLEARDFFGTVTTSEDTFKVPFQMWSMSEGGATLRRGPPRFGEHTDAILSGSQLSARKSKKSDNKENAQ